MLYISTRNKAETYTAFRALHEDFAPDGGQYVPFHLPVFTQEELKEIQCKPFGEVMAQILNLFFSARLTGWDVECCVGRNPVRMEQMNHRLIVAESWHNPDGSYNSFETALYKRVCEGVYQEKPSNWARTAIAIALLFAVSREINAAGVTQFDVVANTADFLLPMAAFYARQMGLPVGKIICACNDNGAPWDLIHRGEFNTNPPLIRTRLSALDIPRPLGIEQLIFAVLGEDEALRYAETCEKRGVYRVDEETLGVLNHGLFAAVVGADRVQSVIGSMYRTNKYLLDPYTALSYGGLQDYRSRTGESQYALLLSQNEPMQFAATIASAVGVSEAELRININRNKE